jgi:hypothetical protein
MKNIIKKILKEEDEEQPKFDPSKLESPEISISPRTQIEYAEKQLEWVAYIPEIGKMIKFYMNPEEWNMFATIRVEDVGSRGHGSFGDDPHPEYQESIFKDITKDRYSSYYNGKVIGKGERYEYVDIKDVVNDLTGFSKEAEDLTREYKKQIQSLTAEYVQKVRELPNKYNFTGSGEQKAVTVDSKGNHKTESDFEKEGKGWWDHPDEYRWKSEDYKNRRI